MRLRASNSDLFKFREHDVSQDLATFIENYGNLNEGLLALYIYCIQQGDAN